MIKDYYAGMQSRIIGEVKSADSFARLPLVDLEVDVSAAQSALTMTRFACCL